MKDFNLKIIEEKKLFREINSSSKYDILNNKILINNENINFDNFDNFGNFDAQF